MTPQELSTRSTDCASAMFKAGLEIVGQTPEAKIPLTQDQIAILDRAISILIHGPLTKLRRMRVTEVELDVV